MQSLDLCTNVFIIDRNRLPLFNSIGQISNIDGDFIIVICSG